MRRKHLVVALLGVTLASCASQEDGTLPSPTPLPTATPVGQTYGVDAFVYYDENNNGRLDSAEIVRVPGVDVRIGSQTARSVWRTGALRIEAVPAGRYTVSLDRLPPYYQAGPMPTVDVPSSSAVPIPLRLSIGSNKPNVYLAFGDSITLGEGSTDGTGYRGWLVARLRSYFGSAKLVEDGDPGTRTGQGSGRILTSLADSQPAYALILYGTNDWNDAACKNNTGTCPTITNLQAIVDKTFSTGTLPVLGTIIPSNPTVSTQNPTPAARNAWVAGINDAMRLRAYTQGFLIADLHRAFLAESNLASLFSDHVHPNNAGYLIIAREFFRAMSGDPTSTLTSELEAPAPTEPPDLLSIDDPTRSPGRPDPASLAPEP
jgi:lysophospholipase L1-like esterase